MRGGLLVAVVACAACGGAPSEVRRVAGPSPARASAGPPATRGAACSAPGEHVTLVDMSRDDQKAFRAAIEAGLVVVHASDCGLEVLRGCTGLGEYAWVGADARDDSRIVGANDVTTSLPWSGPALAAAHPGARFRAVTRTVGAWELRDGAPEAADLRGACERATHVVEIVHGGVGELHVEPRAGGGAELLRLAGDPSRCPAAARGASAPADCSVLDVQLAAIRGAEAAHACARGQTWNGLACTRDAPPCPAGHQRTEGRCTCVVDGPGTCESRFATSLMIYARAQRAPRDKLRAYVAACRLGLGEACAAGADLCATSPGACSQDAEAQLRREACRLDPQRCPK